MSFSVLKKIPSFRVNGTESPYSGYTTMSFSFKHHTMGKVLSECGTGVYGVLRRSGQVKFMNNVIITSLMDHSIGSLATLIVDRWESYGLRTIIYVPKTIEKKLLVYLLNIKNIDEDLFETRFDNTSLNFISTKGLFSTDHITHGYVIKDNKKEYILGYSGYISIPLLNVLAKDYPTLYNEIRMFKYKIVLQDVCLKNKYKWSHCMWNKLDSELLNDANHYTFGHKGVQGEKIRKLLNENISCLCYYKN